MGKLIKYAIDYRHLETELVKNETDRWYFDQVKSLANEYRVELSDKDFKRLIKLQARDKDVRWILHKMGSYNTPLIDVLISYMTY